LKIVPSYEEFRRLGLSHNMIPVYAVLPADLETPVSVYHKLVGDDPGYMLESADTNGSFGRFSFIGAQPFAVLTARATHTEVMQEGGTTGIDLPPLKALEEFMSRYRMPELPGLPPFSGGGAGYFAYESVGTFERIKGLTIPEDMVLAQFMFCRMIAAVDHFTNSTVMIYLAELGPGVSMEEAYNNARQEILRAAEKINSAPVHLPAAGPAGMKDAGLAGGAAGERAYMAAVEKAKEHIVAGDIFQVVLSQSFQSALATHPFAVYRRLRRLNPSPYMFYINFGKRKLVGASPEMLVRVTDGTVETCPIAGTRPRGRDDKEDEALAAELLEDVKERAEHAMLVDLGRNDIGRVSVPGTVKVTQMMKVEKFSHVMHLVSKVNGRLKPEYSPADALAACFPAGTVSGAPKVRAMEIIHELEGDYRGPYAGATGYFDFRGNMDTCITIRTMVVDGSTCTVRAGAGIVADSVPDREYREVLNKASALFEVVNGGEV
jgi:anthranilate synthase component 1